MVQRSWMSRSIWPNMIATANLTKSMRSPFFAICLVGRLFRIVIIITYTFQPLIEST